MFKRILQVLNSVADVFLPRFCPICGKRLTKSEDVMCIYCLSELPMVRLKDSSDNRMTRLLWAHTDIEHGLCLMYYRSHSPYHKLIMQFKYKGNAMLAYRMGHLAAQLQHEHKIQDEIDLVVPVPLSRKRLIQRGYNQSEWLAKGWADANHLPIDTKILKRIKHRKLQTQLNREGRLANAKDLYQAQHIPELKGKHILLVDDICTTGATLAACAKAIQESNTETKVSVFALGWSGE